MKETQVAVYNAFSDTSDGGSPAGLVLDAPDLTTDQMQEIACKIGAPATGFVTDLDQHTIRIRFFSPTTEYPMCGHGTIALASWLADIGRLEPKGQEISLETPMNSGTLSVRRGQTGRTIGMLKLAPSASEPVSISLEQICEGLGLEPKQIDKSLPVEMTRSDFNSLLVPLVGRTDVNDYKPDPDRLLRFSKKVGADTIGLITKETVDPDCHIHMREFCPAVGTLESAATGTTNRSLACYLVKHGLLTEDTSTIETEQGFAMGRPSRISARLLFEAGRLSGVWVGGTAVNAGNIKVTLSV